jgi:hypothetical protein
MKNSTARNEAFKIELFAESASNIITALLVLLFLALTK